MSVLLANLLSQQCVEDLCKFFSFWISSLHDNRLCHFEKFFWSIPVCVHAYVHYYMLSWIIKCTCAQSICIPTFFWIIFWFSSITVDHQPILEFLELLQSSKFLFFKLNRFDFFFAVTFKPTMSINAYFICSMFLRFIDMLYLYLKCYAYIYKVCEFGPNLTA